MVLGACTLPLVVLSLYAAYGFVETERFMVVTPDSVKLEGAAMEKAIGKP